RDPGPRLLGDASSHRSVSTHRAPVAVMQAVQGTPLREALAGVAEGAAAEQPPVLRPGAPPVTGPDVPAVDPVSKLVVMATVDPLLRDLEARAGRPGAQDLVALDQLDVVVLRALDRHPEQARRGGNALSRERGDQSPRGGDPDLVGRRVRGRIEGREGVLVLCAGA